MHAIGWGRRMSRKEFNVERSSCACNACVANCKVIPGFLIPSDLPRMAGESDLFEWAEKHLLASPGATFIQRGVTTKIPTLVPAKTERGCIFLSDDNKCTIHEVSPFGCAFFDCQQPTMVADQLSIQAHRTILDEFNPLAIRYRKVWQYLWDKGLRSKSAEEKRREFK